MRCGRCNSIINENDLFCSECGSSVQELKNNNLLINDIPVQNVNQTTIQQPVQQPVQQPMYNQQMNIKKKGSKAIIFIIIGAVLLIACFVLAFVLLINKKPKDVFSKAIDNVEKSLVSSLNTDYDTMSSNLYFKTDVSVDDEENNAMFQVLNKIGIDLTYEIDNKNKISNMELNVKYDGNDALNMDGTIQDDYVYVRLSDKQKYARVNEKVNFENTNVKDIDKLVSGVAKSLKSSLKNEYFKKEKTSIKINGKTTKVNKNTLMLDNKTGQEIAINFLTNLKNDKDFIKVYSSIIGSDESDVISELNDSINDYKNSDSLSDDKMMISIYTKGINQEFVKFEIDYNDLILSVVKEKDNKYVVYTNQSGKEEALGSVTITNKDNKKLYNVEVTDGSEKYGFVIGYSVVYNKPIKAKSISGYIDMDEIDDDYVSELQDELMSKKGFKELTDDMSELNLIGNGYSYDDYDYDYDDDDDYDYDYDYDDDDDYDF